jgi:trehalose-6-phosphate synthase
VIGVHDYHLLLVPGRLRELGVDNPVAFFLHTPFPSPPVFARLPQRAEVLEGMGGADVLAFQTETHRRQFHEAWSSFGSGTPPPTIALPASVDVAAFRAAAADTRVRAAATRLRRRFRDRVLLLGVERLDYTKGILERLSALERLLERRPDLRTRLAYVQLATPSRETLPEYRRLRARVEREFGRLNGRFTRSGHDVPFRYLHRQVSHRQLLAYYLAADVALVTPLCDGMNLVAKEFVVVQAAADGAGALVLSEFAGAADELGDAWVCNPFDAEGTADVVEQVLEVDEDERRKRLAAMADVVAAHDVEQWATVQLARAEEARGSRSAVV